jgi:hypothetical protein
MDPLVESIAGLKSDFDRSKAGFSMEFITIAGRRMGNVSESETRLVVRGNGQASLFRRRGPGDSAQKPPGRFQGTLNDEMLLAFLDVLEHSGIGEFRSETPGPRDPVSFFKVLISGRLFSFTWGSIRPPAPEPVLRLKRLLTDWSNKACPRTDWSLEMSMSELQYGDGRLRAMVTLENRGSDTIHIAHPSYSDFGRDFALFLKYGERQLIEEGITPAPVEIRTAPLARNSVEIPRLVPILPGTPWRIEFLANLEGEAPRGWIGKFAFLHYLPSDSLAGVPVFNGAVFTEEFSW